MYYNKLAGNRNLNGISNFGLAVNEFQGRLMLLAAPVKKFSGAGDGISRPWKHHFQGRLTVWAAPEKGFLGAAGAMARP